MFEKKKKSTKKNEDLMKKAPSAGAVELGDDVLETAAGGRKTAGRVYYPDISLMERIAGASGYRCSNCGEGVGLSSRWCLSCGARLTPLSNSSNK